MNKLIFILFFLVGCSTERSLQRAEVRLANAGRLSAICESRYPTTTDSFYVKDTLVKLDTFLSQKTITDTVTLNDTLYEVKYKPLEIVKTVTKTKVEVKVDRAAEATLKARITQLEAFLVDKTKEVEKYKSRAKSRLNWLILILAVALGYSVRKPVTSLIRWHFPTLKL